MSYLVKIIQIIRIRDGKCKVKPPELRHHSAPNTVRTTRFTWLTWLPLSLFCQFKLVAYQYFSLVTAISYILELNYIGPKSSLSMLIPVLTMLLWTAGMDMWQDLARKKDDKLENNRPVKVWRKGALVTVRWCEIAPGDLIALAEGDTCPADVLILAGMSVSGGFGRVYISTTSLDGETSLKPRKGILPEAPELVRSGHHTCEAISQPGKEFVVHAEAAHRGHSSLIK